VVVEDASDSNHPAVTVQGHTVIRDQASWAQFWAQHDTSQPQRPVPAVDFATDQVIAIYPGSILSSPPELSQTATKVEVDAQHPDDLVVHVTEVTGGVVPQPPLAEPVLILQTARNAGLVRVERLGLAAP
jgi:hypothetical protein